MLQCWRLTPLGCSPYILHSHWMGNATTISYKPKTNDGFTSVPPLLASYHLTPNTLTLHIWCDITKHRFINDETQIPARAEHPSSPSVTDTTLGRWHNTTLGHDTPTSDMNRHNAKEGRPRDGKWERNLARSGSVRGGRFSLEEDIRLPVLPFVC